MAIETHWICDVCGKRVVKSSEHQDVNESGIKDWFSISLHINSVKNPLSSEKRFVQYGYACSQKCLDKVIFHMQQLAFMWAKGEKEEEK